MNDLAVIPTMSVDAISKVKDLEKAVASVPQVDFDTHHVLHGGMYARTIVVPAGAVFTGALIKIATIIIISGDVTVFTGDDSVRLSGYNVLPASAGRKSAFMTHSEIGMTMIFPSKAETVEEAEAEFTDEIELLATVRGASANHILITGE